MTDQPNQNDFSRNDREKNYTAYIEVRGTISFDVMADSTEDAERQAEAEVDRLMNGQCVEIDDVDRVELGSVRKAPPMFRVIRDGAKMQVSRLEPGDMPREPDERGF